MHRLLLVAVLPHLAGCYTIYALSRDAGCDNLIYAGTKLSWESNHGGFIEMPFALVADTVVLPYTIPATAIDSCDTGEHT